MCGLGQDHVGSSGAHTEGKAHSREVNPLSDVLS